MKLEDDLGMGHQQQPRRSSKRPSAGNVNENLDLLLVAVPQRMDRLAQLGKCPGEFRISRPEDAQMGGRGPLSDVTSFLAKLSGVAVSVGNILDLKRCAPAARIIFFFYKRSPIISFNSCETVRNSPPDLKGSKT